MTKQIDIKELIPFMKDGWVAMDKNEDWYWFGAEPYCDIKEEMWMLKSWEVAHEEIGLPVCMYPIKPVEDWTKSLIKVENKDE